MIDIEMLRPTADEMLSGLVADQTLKMRMLFRASAINNFSSVADEMIGGLSATPALRHRILLEADRSFAQKQGVIKPGKWPSLARFAPAAGMAVVLAFMVGLGANYARNPEGVLSPTGAPAAQTADFVSYRAGSDGTQSSVPGYRSLFAGEGANPPLVGIHGRYYRMLEGSVPSGVLGTAIAEVQDYTEEPSLAATVGVVSNVVQEGTQVYGVDGISTKTACIAEVDGVPRLFQRIGYASATFIGNEMFMDTFDVQGQVAALELSGVGVITDEQAANDLMYTLNEFASYQGSDVAESGQALTVYLTNGLSMQLTVQDNALGGCGVWTCPEFFEAFNEALSGQQ